MNFGARCFLDVNAYQYFLTDHLGNVRVTFSTTPEVYSIKATMEDANATSEEAKFENVAETRVSMSAANQTPEGVKAARVSSTDPIGPLAMLQVNKGDSVKLEAWAYYEGDGSTDGLISESALLAALFAGYSGASGVSEVSSQTQAAIENGLDFPNNLVPKTNETNDDAPKAYINYMLFTEQMEFVTSGFVQISTAAQFSQELVVMEPVTIGQNGFLMAYVSNESDELNYVHFDDFTVTHTKTPIVQADNFYPFGGIFSSFVRNYSTPQKYKFTGKELQEEIGVYDVGARMYDKDLGRWWQIDPYAGIYESTSPYTYVENNPISGIDPDGKLVVYVNGFRPGAYGKWLLNPFNRDPIIGVPPPHEWHNPNWHDKDPFKYWGGFTQDWNFTNDGAEADFFVDGSNHALSTADQRFSKGETEGRILAEKLQSGEITLEDGELIKLVGHSMGAAHAMGMAQGLIAGGVDPSLVKVFLFAPHQPNQIQGVDGVEVFQVGRDGDGVSSDGIIPSATGSAHARVPGADWVVAPNRPDEEHGGHYVQTFTAAEFKKAAPRIFQYLIDQGYIHPDGTLVNN